jgi:hypothetical protein
MNGNDLQDMISRGLGTAARRIGTPYIVYRALTNAAPLSSRNRIIKLCAAFYKGDNGRGSTGLYGDPIWPGTFDTCYTQPGDYLVGVSGTFFVAQQQPLNPPECVKTNRTLAILRPAEPQTGGYSGMVAETAETILDGWPASVLSLNARISGNLPETRFGNWAILLPALPILPLYPQVADIVNDDIGRNFVVASSEQSDLGWRLTAREVAG